MYKIKQEFLGSDITKAGGGLRIHLSHKTSQKDLKRLFEMNHPAILLEPKIEVKPVTDEPKIEVKPVTDEQEVEVKPVTKRKSKQ